MLKRIFSSFAAASVLMLGLHTAAPATQAATFNAGCTAYADPAYVSNGMVIGTFRVTCTAPQSSIRIDGMLNGSSETSYGGKYVAKTCYNATQCTATTSVSYFPGEWQTTTGGFIRNGWTFSEVSAETFVTL